MKNKLDPNEVEVLLKKYGLEKFAKPNSCEDCEETITSGPEHLAQVESLAQRWLESQAALENRGVIFITGMISNEALAYITRKILTLHFDPNFTDDIQLIINSGGGYVDAGWALIDLLSFVDNRVITVAMGEVASMAASIFMAGDYRIMTQNATCMIHHFTTVSGGNYRDLIAQRKAEDMEYHKLLRHLINCSKYKTEKDVVKNLLLDQDNFLSPEEVKKHGLCDQIYKPREVTSKGITKRFGKK